MAAQSLVDRDLGRLGSARAVIGQRVRCRRAIATSSAGVALKLAADRRWAAFQPRSDRTHRLTTRASQRDLLPLCKRQTTPFEIPPTPRTDPVLSSQPPSALLPIVPASAAAAVTNSARAIAAQNTCTTSGTIRSENRAINASVHPPSKAASRAPGSRPDSAPIAAPASPYGLSFATTGALLNQEAQMTPKIPPTGQVLRSPAVSISRRPSRRPGH
jgi:hypothetical protein